MLSCLGGNAFETFFVIHDAMLSWMQWGSQGRQYLKTWKKLFLFFVLLLWYQL